jgi:hypothetical protein
MAREPINIFSAQGDAEQVRNLLLTWFPDAEVETEGEDWTSITMEFAGGAKLTILHHRDYYAGPKWSRQKAGMQGYFSRFPLGDGEEQLMATIGSFQFSLATQFEPDFESADDERLGAVCQLAHVLGGVLFTPSALRDPRGRILVSADGEVDEDAEWPLAGLLVKSADFGDKAGHGEKPAVTEDDWRPEPPGAARVARRAVALMILSARAVVERDHASSPGIEAFYRKLVEWTGRLGIDDEFEPWEREALDSPPGRLDRQTAINSMWRIEGLTVLGWALGRAELLPYDQISDVDGVWNAVGLLDDEKVRGLLDRPHLRPAEELERVRKQMLAYHWRLRDFRWNKPRAMDFLAFSQKCWFGSFDVSCFRLIDNELALQGKRIDEASPDVIGTCMSIAAERHRAINWLCWGPQVYSDTDVST